MNNQLNTIIKEGQPRKFYYWLDPLRALCAVLVLLVHARCVMFTPYVNLEPSSQNIFTKIFFFICGQGGFSVCTFFLLSGFLVGGRTIDNIRMGKAYPRRFFLDRLFRIGVPLTGALFITLIVNLVVGNDIAIPQLLGQYTGLQGVVFGDYGGVFWTLAYEIWFYAALLSVIMIATKRHTFIGCLLFGITLVVYCNLIPRFLYILPLGIMSYYLTGYRVPKKFMIVLWCFGLILYAGYLIAETNLIIRAYKWETYAGHMATITQIGLFTIVAILTSQYAVNVPTRRINLVINNLGKKLATFSYSLFLTHYQILKLWLRFGHKFDAVDVHSISVFSLYCFVCIGFAYIFYLCIEKNTRIIQNKVESWLKIDTL